MNYMESLACRVLLCRAMKKKQVVNKTKLNLKKEMIRSLDKRELSSVAGGVTVQTLTTGRCPALCAASAQ